MTPDKQLAEFLEEGPIVFREPKAKKNENEDAIIAIALSEILFAERNPSDEVIEFSKALVNPNDTDEMKNLAAKAGFVCDVAWNERAGDNELENDKNGLISIFKKNNAERRILIRTGKPSMPESERASEIAKPANALVLRGCAEIAIELAEIRRTLALEPAEMAAYRGNPIINAGKRRNGTAKNKTANSERDLHAEETKADAVLGGLIAAIEGQTTGIKAVADHKARVMLVLSQNGMADPTGRTNPGMTQATWKAIDAVATAMDAELSDKEKNVLLERTETFVSRMLSIAMGRIPSEAGFGLVSMEIAAARKAAAPNGQSIDDANAAADIAGKAAKTGMSAPTKDAIGRALDAYSKTFGPKAGDRNFLKEAVNERPKKASQPKEIVKNERKTHEIETDQTAKTAENKKVAENKNNDDEPARKIKEIKAEPAPKTLELEVSIEALEKIRPTLAKMSDDRLIAIFRSNLIIMKTLPTNDPENPETIRRDSINMGRIAVAGELLARGTVPRRFVEENSPKFVSAAARTLPEWMRSGNMTQPERAKSENGKTP
jgi:hypothetical protein